jgi:hypothetical protein
MQTPSDIVVIPRDIHFSTECARGSAWLGGDPVATAVFNALSLTFPDGERLFIDSVRAFRGGLQGKLAEDARAFIAQEAIHSREHAGLNAHLDRSHYPVERIEGSVRRRLTFLRKLGPLRMLGVTIALEHFTAMLADLFDSDPQLWAGTPEEILRLWRWHAMEETEHKAVAFDVFQEVSKNWTGLRRYQFRRAGNFPQARAPLSRLVSPGFPSLGLRQSFEARAMAAAVRLSNDAPFGSLTSNLIAASCSGARPRRRDAASRRGSAWPTVIRDCDVAGQRVVVAAMRIGSQRQPRPSMNCVTVANGRRRMSGT